MSRINIVSPRTTYGSLTTVTAGAGPAMSEPMLQDDSIVSQPDEARKQLYICRIQDENGAETDNLIMHDASQEELLLKEKIDGRVVLKVLKDNAGLLIFAGIMIVLVIMAGTLLWDLTWQGWFSIFLTIFTLVVLLKDELPAFYVLVVAMTLIMLLDIIPIETALSGFANEGVLTVAVLFVVAKAVEVNRALDLFIKHVLGRPQRLWEAQLRMMIPVGFMSAFLNNTPLVAMMIPVVKTWARSNKLPVSKLMMPLSNAAVLGGVCTIIGTSTNLIVLGLLEEKDPALAQTIGFFEIGAIGMPLFVICTLYVVLVSPYLLPNNQKGYEKAIHNAREYSVGLRVPAGSPLIGQTLASTTFLDMDEVHLFFISRDQQTFEVLDPSLVLEAEDELYFAGVVSNIQTVFDIAGLVPATKQTLKFIGYPGSRRVVEAVVAKSSPLVGKSAQDLRFRSVNNSVILGIHRFGQRVTASIDTVILQEGDALLIEAHKSFVTFRSNDQDFALVAQVNDKSITHKQEPWKTIFVVVFTIAMITFSTGGWISILPAALAVSCASLAFDVITFDEARNAIQGDVIVLIAAAFALGSALDQTGAAKEIADSLIQLLAPLGAPGILAGLYFVTTILTEVISNAATVSLMFPIAWEFVLNPAVNLNYKAMCYTLMLAGSSSFCTPIGYQTNLMVQAPGGYQFIDYVKFGIPLNCVAMILTVTIASLAWP